MSFEPISLHYSPKPTKKIPENSQSSNVKYLPKPDPETVEDKIVDDFYHQCMKELNTIRNKKVDLRCYEKL